MNVKAEEKPDGAPEWMVSYADMITIMMSFFVIMFAIASGEAAKGRHKRQEQAALASLQYRFGPQYKPFSTWGVTPGNSYLLNPGTKGKLVAPPAGDPQGTVKPPKKDRSRIRIPGRGDRVVIGGVAYFDEKAVTLAGPQKARLQVIADEVIGKPQVIEIIGHCSARPLPPGSPYRDRWDLAYARCRQTAQALAAMKIDPGRIRIVVVPGNEAASKDESATTPLEDSQIDIALTDAMSGRSP